MARKVEAAARRHDALRRAFRDVIMTADEIPEREHLSIGPLSLNLAVGDRRGVAQGRVVQIFGRPSAGKSTLVLDIIRQWQANDPEHDALYVDFERALDVRYAQALGVDLERLFVTHASTTEQGQDIVERAIKDGFRLIVIDSIAAGLPSSDEGKSFGDSPRMASSAQLWTRFVTRMLPLCDDHSATIVLVNQLRKNFSPMARELEIPWGGMALQYATSVNILLTMVKKHDNAIDVRAQVRKNRLGAPQAVCEFTITYGQGIRHDLDIIRLAINLGLVTVSGSWYRYNDQSAQGIEGAASSFDLDRITADILERYRPQSVDDSSVEDGNAEFVA